MCVREWTWTRDKIANVYDKNKIRVLKFSLDLKAWLITVTVCVCACVCVCVLCLVAQSCSTLCNCMDSSLPGSSVLGDSLSKNTGVGCHALLQGIFPIQGSNPGLQHCRLILYHLSRQGSPCGVCVCVMYTKTTPIYKLVIWTLDYS